jgi:hypothetical protein
MAPFPFPLRLPHLDRSVDPRQKLFQLVVLRISTLRNIIVVKCKDSKTAAGGGSWEISSPLEVCSRLVNLLQASEGIGIERCSMVDEKETGL